MTQALAADVFCQKFPVVFDWTILIESHHLDFAELNSLNCHSTAWSMSKGKPLIYAQIESLIGHGFKKFLIALFQVDSIVKQQIQQLQSLYPACTFKCLQVRDSWFFEQTDGLSLQGEKYLQHYINIFLRHNPVNPSFVWIQKIQSRSFNPLQYLKIDPHHSCPLVWVKEAKPAPKQQDTSNPALATKIPTEPPCETLGFWLDVKGFAHRYRTLTTTSQPVQGSRIQTCFQQVKQHCEEILLPLEDCNSATEPNNDSMVASRCFNRVSIDQKMGIVIKQSSEVQKIQQEVNFYQNLPAHLQIYFPRLVDSGVHTGISNADTVNRTAWYSLEYYPYKSLSQYFVYYALPIDSWNSIFDRLLFIHQQFTKTASLHTSQPSVKPQLIDSNALNQFYAQKLSARLTQAKTSAALEQILAAETICINGQILQGFNALQPWLMQQIKQLSTNVEMSFVHGDLCFSNLLFEPGSGVLRLIDPRGDFMGSVNQGDPRYDLAKVLHSVHGRYDFIINDLFRLEQDGLNFELSMPQSDYLETLQNLLFDKIRAQTPYAVHELILLESLLFLTMLPLHHDQPKRQIAFLLTGLKLLNGVYHKVCLDNKDAFNGHTALPNSASLKPAQALPVGLGSVKTPVIETVISV